VQCSVTMLEVYVGKVRNAKCEKVLRNGGYKCVMLRFAVCQRSYVHGCIVNFIRLQDYQQQQFYSNGRVVR